MLLPKRTATLELEPLLEDDEPTIRAAHSHVLQALDRAPDLDNPVEAREHLRCEILNALARAERLPPFPLAPPDLAPPPPAPRDLPGPRPRARRILWRSSSPLAVIVVAFAIVAGLAVEHGGHAARVEVTRLVRRHAGFFALRAAMRSAAPLQPGS